MSNEQNATADEDKGTGINWGRALVRDAHGTADLEATMRKLEAEARSYVVANEVPTERIRAAVISVYEQFPKTSFDLGSLTNRVVTEMKVAAGSETKIGEAVKGFIRGESKQVDAFLRGEAAAPGLFAIARGKNGGVRPAGAEYLDKARKALAAKNAQ